MNVFKTLRGALGNASQESNGLPKLRNLLVGATFKQLQPSCKGNSQCQQACCKDVWTHRILEEVKRLIFMEAYEVKATNDCKTYQIVHAIECKRCWLQYVGKTENACHKWMNGHQADIKHQYLEKPGPIINILIIWI